MLGTDSDDDSAADAVAPPPRTAPVHKAAAVETPEVAPEPVKAAQASGVKAAEAAFDSDDDAAVAAPKPAAKPVEAKPVEAAVEEPKTDAKAVAKAAEAAFDGDDDSFDAKAAFNAAKPDTPADSDKPKGPAVSAMQEELDSDEAVDHAFPAPQSASQLQLPKARKGSKAPAKKANFMDGVYDAAAGNLPNQYAAWSPEDQNKAGSQSKKALAQMEADFDDDDDSATPTAAPKRKQSRHHQAPAPPPPPPAPKADDDGVVYDDDDLPKHHVNLNMRGLEGGWQALMKKPEKKAAHSPKLDPDVQIMESLYTKDGALPSQYTAWSPDDGPKAAPAAPAAPQPKADSDDDDSSSSDGGDAPMDLEAAAKAFAKDPEKAFDFMQVGELVHRAAAEATSWFSGTSFLEASTVSVDTTRSAAATNLLEQYAEVLNSKPLRQLAKAKLSPPKLQALFQQLQKVDPLGGKQKAGKGKQAKAEQMCKYFQEHLQSASPVQKAVSLIEGSSNDLAEAVSRRAALLEEIDARTQLQRTMEQDISSLTTLAGLAKQGEDTSALVALGEAAAAATEGVQEAHAELKDFLDLALQKRIAVKQAQSQKLAQLQADVKSNDANIALKKKKASMSQAAIEKARKKLAGIATSCDATLDALARRRHAGHMEAHAIEIALKVLGSK